MKLSPNEIEFLQQSNYIEGVTDSDSLEDAVRAWEYLKRQKEMTEDVILETHKRLMKRQPHIIKQYKGVFRRCSVWIGGRKGLSWYAIEYAINHWCSNVNDLVQNKTSRDPEDFLWKIIKQHHVEYERIHPFIDGNGRTGRLFMNWERLKVGLEILIIKEEEKSEYYDWFAELT